MISALYSSCPACEHRFIPWTAWKISRWSCIGCPACRCQLNRRLDGRDGAIFLVFVLSLGALLRTASANRLAGALVLVAGVAVFYVLDICTVRLRRASTHTRLDGYED